MNTIPNKEENAKRSKFHLAEYEKLIDKTLKVHKHPPYERQNEGLVYLGYPEIIYFENNTQKHSFVYMLCLFVLFDLKIFELYREYYEQLKIELCIPKFEYGLTNTFIYPEKLFNHYQIGINQNRLIECYQIFEEYILEKIHELNMPIDFLKIENSIRNDKEVNCGHFGRNLCRLIVNKTKKLCALDY
jgi:hypothetical protein